MAASRKKGHNESWRDDPALVAQHAQHKALMDAKSKAWEDQIVAALAAVHRGDHLKAERRKLAQESTTKFEARLRALARALDTLRVELAAEASIIGWGPDRRRASQDFKRLMATVQPWIDRYGAKPAEDESGARAIIDRILRQHGIPPSPARPPKTGRGGARRGQGRRTNTFLNECKRIARQDGVGYAKVAKYLASLQRRMTPADRERLFGTDGTLLPRTIQKRLRRPIAKKTLR